MEDKGYFSNIFMQIEVGTISHDKSLLFLVQKSGEDAFTKGNVYPTFRQKQGR